MVGGGWCGCGGTLLGPEGSVALCWVAGFSGVALWLLAFVVGGCLVRPYVENLTVDASIFVVF